MDTDLRDTRARLIKLAIAAVIGAVVTYLAMRAMTSSGPAANKDPVGAATVPLLAIAVWVVTTAVAHGLLSRRRRA